MSEKLEDTLTWKFYTSVCRIGNFTTRNSDKTSYGAKLSTVTDPDITGNIWFGFFMFLLNGLFVGLYPSYRMIKTFKKFKRNGLAVLVGLSFVLFISFYPAMLIGGIMEKIFSSSSVGVFFAWVAAILIILFIIFQLAFKKD